jgi:SpoVK/Ycf46/Vps4 family AAA+-type ATPase
VNLIGKLLMMIIGDPADRFLEGVKARVAALDGPDSEDKRSYASCDCPTCLSAKQFIEHRTIVKAFGPDKWSPSCGCHICRAHQDDVALRAMPSDDCECTFCIRCRQLGVRSVDELVAPVDGDDQVIDMKPAEDPFIKMVRELGEKIHAAEREKQLGKTNNPMLALPPASENRDPYKEKTLQQLIDETARVIAASARVSEPTLMEVVKPRSTVNEKSNRTTQGEEIMANPTVPSAEFRNRKVVDIGGKEFPIFETKGTKIAVPEGMHKLEAAEWLYKQHQEEQKMVGVNEEIKGFPLDAAVALFKALNKHFGWTDTQAVPTWFGAIPPQLITVATGVRDSIQVPWGRINMPGIEDGYIQWSGAAKPDGTLFMKVSGEVKKKDRETIAKIVKDAKEILAKESIYKGKAIRVKFPELDPDNGPDLTNMPSFYDTSKVRPEEVVFAKPVEDQINVSLFTPIRHTEACRKNKIPLKRTVLFAGTYGVGKTLTAAVTAQEAEKNGWTFIMPESAEDLRDAVEFAKQYEPAVIFVEDIDSVVKGERSVDMDSILNIVDGAESKGRELMIVLTTNHPEAINKAMLRPGRIDALIEVAPPDAYAAEKLIRVYARTLLKDGEDVSPAAKLLSGHKPASIREIVERAKLAAIFNHGDDADHITNEDLVVAVNIMQPHFALMEEKKVEEKPTIDSLVTAAVHKATQNGTTVVAKKAEARA